MTNDDGLFFTQRRDETNHVTRGVEDAVGLDIRRRAGAAKAAHVGGDNVEAGRSQRRNLVAPGVGQFRPAVAEHDERAFALFEQEHLDPVDRDRAGG